MTLGIVTGLAAEARVARPLGLMRAGGGLPEGAEAAAEWLVAQKVDALLSFGLAGGLDPALRPGDIVVPQSVREGDHTYPTDPALSARFARPGGTLLAGTAIVAAAEDKARLFAATGALAIDLESGAVARVAARHGLPFAVLRAICDPAGRSLPPAALAALDAAGAIGIWRVLASVARHPGQVPPLIALGRDAATARAALADQVKKAKPGALPLDPAKGRWPLGTQHF
jgi:adenosylhomocysteine nucleosidase